MAKINLNQTNFTSGEISPLMYGRVDVNRYANGAKQLLNFIVCPQGGIRRRPGTRFVAEIKNSARSGTRLIDFQFSNIQSYAMEFGELYVRIYADGGIIMADGAPGPYEVATPYADSDIKDLRFTQSADVLYITHPRYRPAKIQRYGQFDWRFAYLYPLDGPYLTLNSTDTTLKISSVVDSANIVSSADIFVNTDVGRFISFKHNDDWNIAQITEYINARNVKADYIDAVKRGIDPTVFIVYDSVSGHIKSNKSNVFGYSDVGKYIRLRPGGTWVTIDSVINDDEFQHGSVDTVTYSYPTVTVTMASRTITAMLTASDDLFQPTDYDRHFRLNFSGNQTWGRITAITNSKNVEVLFETPIPLDPTDNRHISNFGLTALWRLGAWSGTTGYPSCVCIHEQRLIFAATPLEPQTIWMSCSGDYENFAPTLMDSTVTDNSGVTYTFSSNKASRILWMQTGPALLVGTNSCELQVKATSINEPITPTNVSITVQTYDGSTDRTTPFRVGAAVLFTQRSGKKCRELTYDFQLDAFVSRDLTMISEHILNAKCSFTTYQKEPHSILWHLLDDGTIAGMTYVKDQEVVAWHRHQIGGNGFVESMTTIPSSNGQVDILYMIVRRTINGHVKRYVEYMEVDYRPVSDDDKNSLFYVDCGLTYQGVGATEFTNIPHLEGETVSILADGAYIGEAVIAGGKFTIPTAHLYVSAGLPYRSLLETLPLEGGSQMGTSQGKIKKVDHLDIKLLQSLDMKHGTSLDNLIQMKFRDIDVPGDTSPRLFTGNKRIELEMDYGTEASYFIVQDSPYPLNINSVMPVATVFE